MLLPEESAPIGFEPFEEMIIARRFQNPSPFGRGATSVRIAATPIDGATTRLTGCRISPAKKALILAPGPLDPRRLRRIARRRCDLLLRRVTIRWTLG